MPKKKKKLNKKINRAWFTKKRVIISVIVVAVLAFFYWEEKGEQFADPVVTVTKATKKTVPVYLNYVGNTSSVRDVDIRARVEGFLLKRLFEEGDDVKRGELMYIIDEKSFKAALEEARGRLKESEAALAFAREQVKRYRSLVQKDYVTKENYDNMVTTMKEAEANVQSSKAAVEQARINLGYCRMYAPFNGRVGRTFIHTGNLVGAGQDTRLATIVQLDPIWAYFSPSDEEVHKILKERDKGPLKVDLTFSDGTKYEHDGRIDFVDNEVNIRTSTLTMRAVIPNPKRTLLPGIYVNVRLHLKEMPNMLVVPERAFAEDQGGKYVMFVEENDVVNKSYVTVGELVEGERVVLKGVKEGDRVVVDGLQLIRPGMSVAVKMMERGDTVRGIVKKAVLDRP